LAVPILEKKTEEKKNDEQSRKHETKKITAADSLTRLLISADA